MSKELTEIERLHELIRRGLAYGDQFRTPYAAAAARAELREAAGMKVQPQRPVIGERIER